MYVTRRTEPQLWTVGFFGPDGKFETDSDHDSEKSANDRAIELNGGSPSVHQAPVVPCWMTKREYFAALAMQGIVASGEASQISPDDMEWVANYSVATADALIARLEK
jgi:hypothetical protein